MRSEEAAMETYEMFLARKRAEAKKAKLKSTICEIFGSVAFLGILVVLGWLCCAVSGYHWE